MVSGTRLFFVGAILLAGCAKGAEGGNDFDTNGVNGGSGTSGTTNDSGSTGPLLTGPLIDIGDATFAKPDASKSPVDPSKVVTVEGGLGGYELGPEITTMGKVDTGINASEEGCGTVVGIVRDFKGLGEQ